MVHHQENVHQSPEPFSSQGVGSGNETTSGLYTVYCHASFFNSYWDHWVLCLVAQLEGF